MTTHCHKELQAIICRHLRAIARQEQSGECKQTPAQRPSELWAVTQNFHQPPNSFSPAPKLPTAPPPLSKPCPKAPINTKTCHTAWRRVPRAPSGHLTVRKPCPKTPTGPRSSQDTGDSHRHSGHRRPGRGARTARSPLSPARTPPLHPVPLANRWTVPRRPTESGRRAARRRLVQAESGRPCYAAATSPLRPSTACARNTPRGTAA